MLHSDTVRPRRDSGNGRGRGATGIVRVWIWLVLLACGFSGFAQMQRTGEKQEPKWEVLDGCRLVTNSAVDGDSFHVSYKGREYIFRLYFVDAPESDANLKDRIKDQAVYFGISPNEVPRAGMLASRFTREKLTGRDITVITRWQNGLGRSSLARFYGVVSIGGTNLAEELVANGFARISGLRANWPDGPRSTTFINKLKNLELAAREKKRGVWNEAIFRAESGEETSAVSTNSVATATPASPTLVDVNTATFEELQKLPGIGPKLAERIIARRPFKTVADLNRVPGIGPATLKRLEPLICVTGPTP
ncbi:MAG: helix-hairpin-helix domain-containing protein [Verrucomicrobiota bacterium]